LVESSCKVHFFVHQAKYYFKDKIQDFSFWKPGQFSSIIWKNSFVREYTNMEVSGNNDYTFKHITIQIYRTHWEGFHKITFIFRKKGIHLTFLITFISWNPIIHYINYTFFTSYHKAIKYIRSYSTTQSSFFSDCFTFSLQ